MVQHKLLKIIPTSVQSKIFDEVGDAKFCALVDELVDEFSKSQMTIILRYVDSIRFDKF